MNRNPRLNLNLQTIDRSPSSSSVGSHGTVASGQSTTSTNTSSVSSRRRRGILGKIETGFRSVFRRFSRPRTSLTEMDIQLLSTATGYTREEVLQWHEKFLIDYPNGYMTRKQFISMYKSLFPKGDAERFARHIFRAFDLDNSHTIDFHEFLIGLSLTSATNSIKTKLEWTFNVFDIDGNGLLTRRECLEVIDAIVRCYLSTQGNTQNSNNEQIINQAKKSMMNIFDNISHTSVDKLTRSQFVEGCSKDQFISHLLAPTTNTVLINTHDTNDNHSND
ncbi:unnamed protein product [Rotaria sp. Silwood1]|nr:unnamed protein product [Rotaria sp. Silwood1]CAF3520509.1 unnamed protein product [Rotaria sp. Silwood1]CAF3521154.1 unnamed protein product [Rotaria sp. Silwood1]CAF4804732.1 unnamed protein product [Rotaria sp. Silwood1]CAF4910192.1 unnamed protein product [Rotaria sp. Silwood1]